MSILIKNTKNYRVMSADTPQLVTCKICGRNTRTEWQRKDSRYYPLFACSAHTEKEVTNCIKKEQKKYASQITMEGVF